MVTQEQILCSRESKTRLVGRNNKENRIRESRRAWKSVLCGGRWETPSIVTDNRKLKEFLSDNFYCLWERGGAVSTESEGRR